LALALWREITAADDVQDGVPQLDDYVLCWDDTNALITGLEEATAAVYVSEAAEMPGKHWVRIDDEMLMVVNVLRVKTNFVNN
jgi:hypothetical protein